MDKVKQFLNNKHIKTISVLVGGLFTFIFTVYFMCVFPRETSIFVVFCALGFMVQQLYMIVLKEVVRRENRRK